MICIKCGLVETTGRGAKRCAFCLSRPREGEAGEMVRFDSMARRLTRKFDEMMRDDIYQEAMIGVLRAIRCHVPGPCSLSTYAYRCAVQAITKYLRDTGHRRAFVWMYSNPLAERSLEGDARVERDAWRQLAIARLMARSSPVRRQVLAMSLWGAEPTEIARAGVTSRTNVFNHLRVIHQEAGRLVA